MKVIGDINVLRDLHQTQVHTDKGRKRLRLYVGTPGIKSGAVGAQFNHALHDFGITPDRFDIVFGVSASSWNVAAYAAGQAALVPAEYEHLCDAMFFPREMHRWLWDAFFLQYLADRLRPRLDQKAIRTGSVDVQIGISDKRGKLELESARNAEDILDLCHASSEPPLWSRGKLIKGSLKFDGGCAHPCPLGSLIKRNVGIDDEADILVVFNRSPEISRLELRIFRALVHGWMWQYGSPLRRSTAAMDVKISRALKTIHRTRKQTRFRVAAVHPEGTENIFPLEWRSAVMRSQGASVYQNSIRLLESLKPMREV